MVGWSTNRHWAARLAKNRMSDPSAGLAENRPSDAGQKGPKRLLDDNDFWKIYEKGETKAAR